MDQNKRFPLPDHKLFPRLWRWRYPVLIVYWAAVWLGIYALLFSPPAYEATATISIKPGPLFVADAEKISAAPPEQFARPQITLLESESVIRRAIGAVGEERLYPPKRGGAVGEPDIAKSIFAKLYPPLSVVLFPPLSPVDYAYINARKHLTIRQEPQTDIIVVAYRNSNPQVAVDFTNAVVRSFIHRYFEVYSNIGAVDFFWEQKKKSEEAFARASAAAAKYSSSNGLFNIQEQRRLLLQQRSEAEAALRATRGSIMEKESEVATIPGQLDQMKQPLERATTLKGTTIPKDKDSANPAPGPASAPAFSGLADDRPLLLVRVYQDTVASLVRTKTEIAGLRALETHQQQALQVIESQLTSMGSREAEFERLQLEVMQSKANAELFSKKAFGEQLARDLNERKFTPVQILQEATIPPSPVWPRPNVLLTLGFLLCIVPWVALVAIRFALVKEANAAADRTARTHLGIGARPTSSTLPT